MRSTFQFDFFLWNCFSISRYWPLRERERERERADGIIRAFFIYSTEINPQRFFMPKGVIIYSSHPRQIWVKFSFLCIFYCSTPKKWLNHLPTPGNFQLYVAYFHKAIFVFIFVLIPFWGTVLACSLSIMLELFGFHPLTRLNLLTKNMLFL